jgi:hypothetical protein
MQDMRFIDHDNWIKVIKDRKKYLPVLKISIIDRYL